MSKPQFMTRTIAVHLKIIDDQPSLTILDNPHVPRDTVATIAWVATANSEPFEFAGFEWEKTDNAVSNSVWLGPGMVAMARNELDEEGEDVKLPYRLAVTTPSLPGKVIWSSGKGTQPIKPIAGLSNIFARLKFRLTSWSPWHEPEEKTEPSSKVEPAAQARVEADPHTSSHELYAAMEMATSGPMIILTRV